MGDLILHARWLVTGIADRNTPQIIDDGAMLVRDGAIVVTGSLDEVLRLSPDAELRSYPDHAMLPGFVNSHHHLGVTPVQLGVPDMPLELWWAARIPMRRVDLYLDTLYSAFEMIASGVTTVQHIQGWIGGGYDAIRTGATKVLDAYRSIGMRASYCYAVREQNRIAYEADAAFCARLPQDLGEGLAAILKSQAIPFSDFLRLFDELTAGNAGQKLTRIQLAPANLHWCSDESLVALNDKSRAAGVPMHMHLLETAYQKEYARRRSGKSAVKHIYDLGILGPHMTLGHGVWMTEADIEIMADTGTCLCHNCSSNFRLRSGVAPVNPFAAKGVTVALGLDEAGINEDRDMLQEMRLVLRAHRTPGMDDSVPTATQVLGMATEAGAKTTPFAGQIGRLEAGRLCDAVLINWKTATYPYQDPGVSMVDALIQRAKTQSVDAVYIGGELVYEGGRFLKIDRAAILAEIADNLARPPTADDLARRELSLGILPYIKDFYAGYLPATASEPFYGMSSRV
jgi:cytosine/adenosine deaminase-related metal-dependent hydrolase